MGRSERSFEEALLRAVNRYYKDDEQARDKYERGVSGDEIAAELEIVVHEVKAVVVNPPRVGDYKVGVIKK
jgi:hypothetical protein